ncbi:MAG: hydroxyacid dehydrogenase [Blastocatellia bacterium]|nr:hydroxyacid dehydrogenase [Blastocatellia bacterium]
MKVLVADKFPDAAMDALRAAGCEVHYNADLKDDALVEAVQETGADVLVVRSTKVNAAALTAGRLSLVVRSGAGYNTIDVATASSRGIYVSNCPGKNSIAVAELAFGLILSLDRRIPDNVAQFRDGKWNKKEFSKAKGVFGQRLGLIGLGQIGQEMVTRAKAFGMPVVAWSRSLTPARAAELGIEYKDNPADVAASCDVLSVHVALNAETRGLINAYVLNGLPKGAMFINTARAEVVDEAALVAAVNERGLRAGLDVFDGEPSGGTGEVYSQLRSLPGVYVTHHVGASTDQAQDATSAETVRIIVSYKDTGSVPNVVNLAKHSPATHLLVVRHFDRVGVLAHVFNVLKQAGINVQETENIVFEGAGAAIARIHLDQAPETATLDAIRSGNADIIELSLLAL